MKETLFDLPVSLSPRLKWLDDHGVVTHYAFDEDFGNHWCASIGIPEDIHDAYRLEDEAKLCYGVTETEAVQGLAARQGWRLWNENV